MEYVYGLIIAVGWFVLGYWLGHNSKRKTEKHS